MTNRPVETPAAATHGAPLGAPLGAVHGASMARHGAQAAAPCSPALPGEHGARRYSVLKIKAHGAQHGAGHGTRHGTGHGAPVCTPDGARVDAEYLIYRLEEAGRTLLALPHSGPSTRLRTARHDIVQSALEAYGWHSVEPRLRPPVPSPAQITRMDEALDWIPRIPQDRYVLRRILGARALISPITGRHLFSWRRLATLLGADHKAIQRWHAQGIDLLVHLLAAP